MIWQQKHRQSDEDVIKQRNIGTRSSATNSRALEETMPKKNIIWGYIVYQGVCFI